MPSSLRSAKRSITGLAGEDAEREGIGFIAPIVSREKREGCFAAGVLICPLACCTDWRMGTRSQPYRGRIYREAPRVDILWRMGTVTNEMIGLAVCADAHEKVEYPVVSLLLKDGGPYNFPERCGRCGERMIWNCKGSGCKDPVFHPNDYESRFHRLCGTPIPWYDALIGGTPEIGMSKKMFDALKKGEVTYAKATGKPAAVDEAKAEPAPVKYKDLKRTTWDQLERGEVVRVDPPAPQRVVKFLTDPVYRGMQSGIEKFVMGLVLAGLATGATAIVLVAQSLIHF